MGGIFVKCYQHWMCAKIFINNTITVYAVDFGISSLDGHKTSKIVAKNEYQAPEVKEKKGEYTLAADVYSLGVMFRDYLSLGGDSPLKDIIQNMTKDDYKSRPKIGGLLIL